MCVMHVATDASVHVFPPNNGDRGTGYQTVGRPTGMFSNFCDLESSESCFFVWFFSLPALSLCLNDLTIYL